MNPFTPLGKLGPVCRLGLATRGTAALEAADVRHAIDRGIHLLHWCGKPDGLSRAVRELGARRDSVLISAHLESATAREATPELDRLLGALGTDRIDLVTYYYVEHEHEWQTITGPGGAHEAMVRAQAAGKVGALGVTSHQRKLAATMAASGLLDAIMVRYNAAHRGAERDLFPVTDRLCLPVITYTSLRWKALLDATPHDPPGFRPPTAPECYRFVLASPSVAVALTAPHDGRELDQNLAILDDWTPLSAPRYAELAAHGQRVRRHAGRFP